MQIFSIRLGGSPVFLTLLLTTAFYVYAACRGLPLAFDGLTVALVGLALVPRQRLLLEMLITPESTLILATCLQLLLAYQERSSWRGLIGAAGLMALMVVTFPSTPKLAPMRGIIIYHLLVVTVLLLGAVFDDWLGRLLRSVGTAWTVLTCVFVVFVPFTSPAGMPAWLLNVYPAVVAALLASYALALRDRPMLAGAGLIAACWVGGAGWRGYRVLRLMITGLDYMTIGLVLFALALAISLGKSSARSRGLAARQGKLPNPSK